MKPLTPGLVLGALSGLCQAGVLGFRQAPAPTCSPSTYWNAVTVTKTVTSIPPTVTILLQDPNAIASTKASIDTVQISQQSIEAPVSAQPLGPQTFTHTIAVSGYEATELSNNPGGTVYYLSKGPPPTGTTPSIVPKVTTVTVLPVPASASHQQNAQNNTSTSTRSYSSSHTAFASPYGGWNNSLPTGSSLFGPAIAGTGASVSPAPLTTVDTLLPTFPPSQRTSTVTEFATVYATLSAESGYESEVPAYGTDGVAAGDLDKRQTCVWISATIGGQEVGWCNNWAGGSTLTFTSWETTTTPGYIPGIGTITKASSTKSPLPTTTNCGESGPFEIGFDDLPENGSDDYHPVIPFIQNPYNYMIWGDGWKYLPPPNGPFPPQSGDRLAEWDPSVNSTVLGSPDAGSIPPGSIGSRIRNDKHYWFNVNSAWVGCDNGSRNLSLSCDFVATAYQWNNYTKTEVVVATQHFHIPPCPDYVKCQLTKINFNYQFYKLSVVQFYANIQGKISMFWIDTIDMNWYDNSCDAGLARIQGQW